MGIINQLESWQQEFEQTVVYPFEGLSPTMYLDTVGLVTVGRGCQISAPEAQTLPFTLRGVPASPSEILRDYTRVQGMGAGHSLIYYSSAVPAPCVLPVFAVEALCQKRIQSATALLVSIFPGFAKWPDPAKIATLEMPWGLGEYKFRTSYPLLRKALSTENWRVAATECLWADPAGIYARRNAQRQALYLKAAKEAHA